MKELHCISHSGKRKLSFDTRDEAIAWLKEHGHDPKAWATFDCPDCGQWHLSSPKPWRKGTR